MCILVLPAGAHLERLEVAHVVHEHVGVHRSEPQRVAVVPLGEIVDGKASLWRHIDHHQLPDASVAHQTAAVNRPSTGANVRLRKVMLEKLLQIELETRFSWRDR